jgi:hypothetical protein
MAYPLNASESCFLGIIWEAGKRKMAVERREACGANLALVGWSHNFRPRPKAEPVGTKPGGTKLARRVWCLRRRGAGSKSA